MDEESASTVALFAIHPQFAERIFSGEKRVEFRKRRPKEDITHVLVYATSPTKKVLGLFAVEEVDEGSPSEIWERYQEFAGIEESDFLAYYSESKTSVAILIGEVRHFSEPVELESVKRGKAPPQSFEYLPKGVLRLLPV